MTIVEKMQKKRNEIMQVDDEKIKEVVSKIGEEFEKEQDENLEVSFFTRVISWNNNRLILRDEGGVKTIYLTEEVKYASTKQHFLKKVKEMLEKEGIKTSEKHINDDKYITLEIKLS